MKVLKFKDCTNNSFVDRMRADESIFSFTNDNLEELNHDTIVLCPEDDSYLEWDLTPIF